MQITKGKITFFIEVSEIKNNGSRIYGGGCCQGINGSQCSVLCKPLLTISLRYVLILWTYWSKTTALLVKTVVTLFSSYSSLILLKITKMYAKMMFTVHKLGFIYSLFTSGSKLGTCTFCTFNKTFINSLYKSFSRVLEFFVKYILVQKSKWPTLRFLND